MTVTTDLITTPDETPARTPGRAKTDDEILSDPELTSLLWSALQAFATDPEYLTEICDAAYHYEDLRDLRVKAAQLVKLRRRLRGKVTLDGECWTWTAATTNKGVPSMKRPGTTANMTVRAWTVEQWHGPDDTRWMIRAECGNRLCVNPDHATWRHVERKR